MAIRVTSKHHRNIQILLIEIFKTKIDLAPPIMESMFKKRNTTYNLKNFQELETERQRTVYFGLETLSYRFRQLWSLLAEHMRQINFFDQFKRSVRKWICNTYPCGLYEVYLNM